MNRKNRRYRPRNALCSLRRLRLLIDRITRNKKELLIYGVYGGGSDIVERPVFYYIHLDAGSYIDKFTTLHTMCRRDYISQFDNENFQFDNGNFDLKHWNVAAAHRSNCYLFENYFFALAYKLKCEHDQQAGR